MNVAKQDGVCFDIVVAVLISARCRITKIDVRKVRICAIPKWQVFLLSRRILLVEFENGKKVQISVEIVIAGFENDACVAPRVIYFARWHKCIETKIYGQFVPLEGKQTTRSTWN